MIIPEPCSAVITSSQDVSSSHMKDEKDNDDQSLIGRLIAALLRLPWTDVLRHALKAPRETLQGCSYQGLYEVLEYESTLELGDCVN